MHAHTHAIPTQAGVFSFYSTEYYALWHLLSELGFEQTSLFLQAWCVSECGVVSRAQQVYTCATMLWIASDF